MSKVTLSIDGMACNHCTSSVTSALTALNGVETVAVSLEKKNAVVTFDGNAVTVNTLSDTVNDLGFTVTEIREG